MQTASFSTFPDYAHLCAECTVSHLVPFFPCTCQANLGTVTQRQRNIDVVKTSLFTCSCTSLFSVAWGTVRSFSISNELTAPINLYKYRCLLSTGAGP